MTRNVLSQFLRDMVTRNVLSQFLRDRQINNMIQEIDMNSWIKAERKLCNASYCDYFMFESYWKEWNSLEKSLKDDEKDGIEDFYDSKQVLMETLLQNKQWDIQQIEDILNWSLIQRDSNGFISSLNLRFPTNYKLYSSIDGVEINL